MLLNKHIHIIADIILSHQFLHVTPYCFFTFRLKIKGFVSVYNYYFVNIYFYKLYIFRRQTSFCDKSDFCIPIVKENT